MHPEDPGENERYEEDPEEIVDAVGPSRDDCEDENNVSESICKRSDALIYLQYKQNKYDMIVDSLEEGYVYTSHLQ